MLKVALPRPSSDAVIRDGGRASLRPGFDDEPDDDVHRLTRAEADDLARRQPALSPWWVVAGQVVVGACMAAAIGAVSASAVAAASALYGAAVVAVPGALMAHGATSRLGAISPVTSTVSLMSWAMVKLLVSVVMLALAPRIVAGLSWPAMLATLAVCMQTYGFALLWRRRPA